MCSSQLKAIQTLPVMLELTMMMLVLNTPNS